MFTTIITLFLYLAVACLLYWAVTRLLAVIPWIPEPIKSILHICATVIICLFFIAAIAGLFGVAGGLNLPRLR